MDEQGWVPVSLIAGFHRVEQLMKGIPYSVQFILDAVRTSTTVETMGDMIRKRNDWMNWILPPAATNFAPVPVPQPVGVPKDGNPEMNNHLQRSSGEGTCEVNKIKDLLREISTCDRIEDIRSGFYNFTFKLPRKMKARDAEIVVKAMEALVDTLQREYELIKREIDDADESYKEAIIEFVDKHPYVVDMPLFEDLFSDDQKRNLLELGTTKSKNKTVGDLRPWCFKLWMSFGSQFTPTCWY
ncbi:la-related protein 1A-like [Papaver somniferum]|uniref:la-related protein 1A-like n=1 Tax=Papaver somniferum TaxID=3469 RepID=UPI000E6F9C40|nr:la-related protein 1A-like [Papaver somniferum]